MILWWHCMQEKISYNIHNIIKIELNRTKPFELLRDLNLRYSYFEVEHVNNPDIILNLGPFKPHNENCVVIDHKYYIKNNYFYCKDSEKNAKWEIEIFGIDKGKMFVNFNERIFGIRRFLAPNIVSQHFLLRTLMEWKLFQKGALMLHAGAVEKDGKAYLFTGRGGAFKTTLIMDLIREKIVNFIGDEYVIIYKGKILSFPVVLQEFLFRFEKLPTEKLRKERYFRDLLSWFFYLRKHSKKEYYKNPIIKISNHAKLNSIFFVKRGKKLSLEKVNYSTEHVARKMILNAKLEGIIEGLAGLVIQRGPFKYLLAYSQIFPKSNVAEYWNKLKDNYKKVFKNITCYSVSMPLEYNKKVLKKILPLIK